MCDIVLKETGVLRASPEIINYVAGIKADLQRTHTSALSDDEFVDTMDQDITSPPIGPLGKDLARIIQRAERVSASCDTPTIGNNLRLIARAFRAAIYSANARRPTVATADDATLTPNVQKPETEPTKPSRTNTPGFDRLSNKGLES